MSELKDLTGIKFGRLTVIERIGTNDRGEATWLCKCDCGKSKITYGSNLRKGRTKSCGCLNSDIARNRFLKHGQRFTRLYDIWRNMRYRCNDVHNKDYGGRGISVCEEWDKSFLSFQEWAYKNGYSKNLTIDRIDNNGNYEPSNCRWATPKEQGNNKRNNLKIYFNGEIYTPSEYAQKYGVSYEKARKLAKNQPQDEEV